MITIVSQPIVNSLKACYKPINISVALSSLMPITFCDVYINNVYYKTFFSTLQSTTITFNIENALQEFLRYNLIANGISTIEPSNSSLCSCFCRFRGSSIDNNGLIVIEPVEPIQGIGSVLPVPGTGIESNLFYVAYSTLQTVDNEDLLTHLSFYKTGEWHNDLYPMSHRVNGYKVNSSDVFPVYNKTNVVPSCILIHFKYKSGLTGTFSSCDAFPPCPLILNLQGTAINNGNNTQTISLTWDTPDPILTGLRISYKRSADIVWLNTPIIPPVSTYSFIFPLGKYDFKIETFGPCDPKTTLPLENIGVETTACVGVSIPALTPPDAVALQYYDYQIDLTGTPPFSISNSVLPGWMGIIISGNILRLVGTPLITDVGADIPVSFRINNCNNSHTNVSFTIDILNITETQCEFNYSNAGASVDTYLINLVVVKTTSPAQLITGPVNILPNTSIIFPIDNYVGVDIALSFSSPQPVSVELISNGITYIPTITTGYVLFSNVTILNGCVINYNA